MLKTAYIYFHVNKINNKIYVGQTIKSKVHRRWQNGSGYSDKYPIGKAIKKYGWDNFHHFVFKFKNITLDQLNETETYWIEFLNTINTGYNLKTEGSNSKLSTDTKIRISKSKTVLRIKQFDKSGKLLKTWDSIKEASQFYKGSYTNIYHCINGKATTAFGFVWRCENDPFNKYKTFYNSKISIDQYTVSGKFLRKWSSITEACSELNLDNSRMTKVLKNKNSITGGFKWRISGEPF